MSSRDAKTLENSSARSPPGCNPSALYAAGRMGQRPGEHPTSGYETMSLLEKLFPFTFTVDSDLLLSQVSPRLGDLCPAAVSGLDFMAVFRCHRPRAVSCYEELVAAENALFLLISHDEQLALKGQMILSADGKRLHFAGMPWLDWINQKEPKVRLHLGDFPKLDSQFERDFHLISQQSMVTELASLTATLANAER